MSKRNIKRPSGFNGQEQQGFFMVSNFDAAIAITNKLTGTQIRLWVYLMMIDPFADETKNGEQIFKPIPSPQEISTKLGANPEVIVKDMRKLKKLGLYDYRLTEWQGYNHSAKKAKLASRKKRKNKVQIESAQELGLNSPSKRLNNPHQGLNSPSERLNNHPQGLNSPSCETEVLPDNDFGFSQTIQTLKTSSYVSNYDTHTQEKVLQDKKKENSQEIFNGSVLCHEKITDELAKSITQQEEEFFRSYSANEIKKIQEYVKIYKEEEKLKSNSSKGFNHRSIYKDKRRANKLSRTQRINWQWLPEGAWSINGKLDPAFQEWLAKKWLFKYNDLADIYEAKANVLAYFHNDPEKLPIRWEQYQEEFIAKAESIKTRLDHKCKIKDKEKKDFCERISALKPLDDHHRCSFAERQSVSANQPIQANNLVLNQYHQLSQDDKDKSAITQQSQNLNVYGNQPDADVKIVIDENDVMVETKQSCANIYAEDEYGAKIKSNDFTGCHQQEQIPVNKNAINALADWLKAKKGGRK